MPKILIIEDKPEVRDLLALFLTKKGFEAVQAASGEEGIGAVQQEKPDLVLLDAHLPDLEASEVIRRIKEAAPDSKVVMLSGLCTPELEQEARAKGALTLLDKSQGLEVIVKVINDILA